MLWSQPVGTSSVRTESLTSQLSGSYLEAFPHPLQHVLTQVRNAQAVCSPSAAARSAPGLAATLPLQTGKFKCTGTCCATSSCQEQPVTGLLCF